MISATESLKDRLRRIPSLKAPLPTMEFGTVPSTPHQLFEMWLDEAIAAGIREPHAMTLSTCDQHGWPDARVLILKNVDERGWHFAIKAESPKARQIATQPKVALTFYWPELGRQIRLRGTAGLLSAEECATDYLERPPGSRASALASQQSEVLSDPTELEKNLAKAEEFLSANPDHVALGWQVYAVAANVVEFWQGASDRNHKRLRYSLSDRYHKWEQAQLWP